MKLLSINFYRANPEHVAKKLLGKYLVRKNQNGLIMGKIVEVEAYLSSTDPAAHSYSGETERNKVLFGKAGKAYVHSMRQHNLIDVVTEEIGKPSSVLIRALEPIQGVKQMMKNRKTQVFHNLTNGPGKVCQAMMITKEHYGTDLTSRQSSIYIIMGEEVPNNKIGISKRVGILKGTNLPLRFVVKDSEFLSK